MTKDATGSTWRSFISVFGLESDQAIRRTAIAAVKSGYAVVPVTPGGKKPVCTLSTPEQREQGRDHPCGVHHAITDPAVADKVFARLAKNGDRYNLGVVAGPSRLLVVDADTAEAVRAFQQDRAEAMGDEQYLRHTPTVQTPGLAGEGGEPRHKDGGHFYFSLPAGGELPWEVTGSMTRHGYDIKWGMSQTLVPPSVRAEGRYVATGDILPAEPWLIRLIQAHIDELTARRQRKRSTTPNDSIARWSVDTLWDRLLSAHDWTDSGKLDKCGCAIWTKPGGGTTSYKSATAHESQCQHYDLDEGHGPLHLWTTEPPTALTGFIDEGRQTITKLQFAAAMDHDGDEAAAITALGLDGPDLVSWLTDESHGESPMNPGPPGNHPDDDASRSQSRISGTEGFTDDEGDATPSDESHDESQPPFWTEADDGLREAIQKQAQKVYISERAVEYLNHRRGLNGPAMMVTSPILSDTPTAVAPEVARRKDGVALLYRGRVNTIFGPSEAGKSWFTLACLQSVVQAGGRVLVIDMEDDEAGFVTRLRLLGLTQDEASRALYVRPWGMVTAAERATIAEAARGADLVVVDSLDAYMALQGQDSNHAVSVRAAGAWLKALAVQANAAVLVVDHASEKGDGPARMQMGSSAKKQFIDGATLRADRITLWRPGNVCRTLIMAGKDRHGWAKAHAHFASDTHDWGRLVELRMTPAIADDGSWRSSLEMRVPPTYEEESGAAESDLLAIEDRIIDFLRSRAGDWQSRTVVYGAAGDKNGRGNEPEALRRLVEQKVIEHRETTVKGRPANEYCYTDET